MSYTKRGVMISPWRDHHLPEIDYLSPKPKWEDITGQSGPNLPTAPNTCLFKFWCDDAVLTTIQADSRFYVVWVDDILEAEDVI